MKNRYKVEEGSQSAHCCFEATVVDTEETSVLGFKAICECFDTDDAVRIAAAMNAAEG